MRSSILFLLLLAFSLTACQQESESISPVENEELSFRSATRPFKGTVLETLSDVMDPDCECEDDDLVVGSSGEGNLTHMGKVTSEATICIESFILDENGQPIGSIENGVCIKLTAANGDELIADGGPHSLLFDPDCLCVTGTFEVVFNGGTGRFEDATGSANLTISFDPATGIYTEEYDGEISY